MPKIPLSYSKRQVDLAADAWRSYLCGGRVVDAGLLDAMQIVDHYRACHQYPLQKATMGLRSTVGTVGAPIKVSQRLKRYMTILDKLSREPKMKLSRMQDIGGCRSVLPDINALRDVQRRLERRSGYVRTSDYISAPRESGYRGVHVILQYDQRAVEVQLRTEVMHSWAIAVERFGLRTGSDLKSGSGPVELLELLKVVSEANDLEEQGLAVPADMLARIDSSRRIAIQFMTHQQGGS